MFLYGDLLEIIGMDVMGFFYFTNFKSFFHCFRFKEYTILSHPHFISFNEVPFFSTNEYLMVCNFEKQ